MRGNEAAERRSELVPFANFNHALARYPASYRCLVDANGSEVSAGEWRLLRLEANDALELANGWDPLDYEPPKRRRVHHGTPQSTSTGSGRVEFDHPHDDPLKQIPAS